MQKFLTIFLAFVLAFWALGKSRTDFIETPTEPITTTETQTVDNIDFSIGTTTEKTESENEITKTKAELVVEPKSEPIPEKQKETEQPVKFIPNFELLNTTTRKSVVNIFCSTKGRNINPISGTGIVINSDGLILTNAHIAQYLLLKDLYVENYVDCVIRTGSPAYPLYKTELVYISTNWVLDNYKMITSQNPTGTGQNDFAFLRITGRTDGSELPSGFDYIEPDDRENIIRGENTLLVSYPAGFLGGISITQNLYTSSALSTINEVFTFTSDYIDVISVGGTVVSQKGASGGAVVDQYGKLIGVISTSTNGETTGERDLRAITIAHINRAMKEELNIGLKQFVGENLDTFVKSFNEITAPDLTKLLKSQLPN